MGFMHILAGVLERPAGRLADPECPHELKALQLALGIPILQVGFTLSFGFATIWSLKRSTTMAMALTPQPFVKSPLLGLRYSSLSFPGHRCSAHGPILLIRAVRTTGSSARESLIYHATLRLRLHYRGA